MPVFFKSDVFETSLDLCPFGPSARRHVVRVPIERLVKNRQQYEWAFRPGRGLRDLL